MACVVTRPKWRGELGKLANNLRGDSVSAVVEEAEEVEFGPERAYLVGVHIQGTRDRFGYSTEESLEELARLAATAGLEVVGRAYQQLDSVNPRTYIGTGKLQELQAALLAVGAETIIFDDELTPGQLRNIEKVLGEKVRLCDRTALILDIFSQRAATKEGQLQALTLPPKWRGELGKLANNLRGDSVSAVVEEAEEVEFGPERAYLVGVHIKGTRDRFGYSTEESLEELARLAATAGLEVVGRAYQQLDSVNPRTYIGTGKLQELQAALLAVGAETIIFDDELTPGQLRNIEKVLGEKVRLCDRTALILDIFSQRAATKEGQLQVELAQSEYQLPRLTRMWSHLERQGGRGQVKGMGEKQIEVDKRLLRTRMATLRKLLDDVRAHRKQYRDRRAEAPVPVVALVGYTNAGKSTLLNRLTDAGVLAEDKLFATLDPTTRRVKLPSGKEVLFTDTVGFIQKLPTQLVAAFRATLEEISDASLLLHVVDVSHPNAAAQTQAVIKVLSELDVGAIPLVTVWNKVDACPEPEAVRQIAAGRDNTLCISAATGAGMAEFMGAVEQRIQNMMVAVEVLVPFAQGDLVGDIHRFGVIETEDYTADGTHIVARVPVLLATKLGPLAVSVVRQELSLAGHGGSRSKAVAEQDGWL
ncbi:hypothetical protein WJX72_004066 [[Myrmecia] bisecta]|uniref:Hflx-type G domain-containing protein n=1 Tax=[Myrmecia] bisecta TaxID=41462 RepID=A0AAW1PPY3_9CHLO